MSARLAIAGLAVAALFGAAQAQAQSTLERMRDSGTVTVGFAGEQPYGWRAKSGEVTGEAPEIARVVLERLAPGVEIDWVEVPFGQLIPGLTAGEFDLVAAGMFITPERCAQVAFSDPTYVIGEAFAVRAGNPEGIGSYVDISTHDKARVGLISGTVEYNYALVTGIPAGRAPLYVNFDEAIDALKAGEVDAVGLTTLTVQGLVENEPELEATGQFYPRIDGEEVRGYGGFAFRRDDDALRAAFNAELGGFLASEAHWALVEPFGFTPDMAPDRTAEDLCSG